MSKRRGGDGNHYGDGGDSGDGGGDGGDSGDGGGDGGDCDPSSQAPDEEGSVR